MTQGSRTHWPLFSLQPRSKILIPDKPGTRQKVMSAVSRYRKKNPDKRVIVLTDKRNKLIEVRRTW